MKVLIIDDSEDTHLILKRYLENAGFSDICCTYSAQEAFEELNLIEMKALESDNNFKKKSSQNSLYDLILLDIKMDDLDGIETCRRIRELNCYRDIPIIMITADHSEITVQNAFDAGANDYITKPIRKVEFIARIKSALILKKEMESRKKTARDLEIANEVLQGLYTTDPLTNLNNRGHFDILYDHEWKRARREKYAVSIIMIDVDYFKAYNDTYGHLGGDNCLIQVANSINNCLKRPADFAARYGGEEFVVVLPNTDLAGAKCIAEDIRKAVYSLKIEHRGSEAVPFLSISCGVASAIADAGMSQEKPMSDADIALYKAKNAGRNCVKVFK